VSGGAGLAPPSHTGPREWDAEVYHRVSQPQFEWASDVLGRLPLRGDEVVLDAGCGTGRVTALLRERLPRGRVIGVDASDAMVRKAREVLGDRIELLIADLTEMRLSEQVDAVFSNAVFHWIADHDRLFARLGETLRPGGRLVAQCGGEGNVASLAAAARAVAAGAAYAKHLAGIERPWNFASPRETEARLERAGFDAVKCWLEPKPVTPERPLDYLATVTLGPYLDRLPKAPRESFVEDVATEMGSPLVLDHVRLNISARRSAE